MGRKVLWVWLSVLTFLLIVNSFVFAQKAEIVPGEFYNLSDYEKITGKKITKFNEAPMLAELVKQGKLPPVEQRLPKNPLVVTPVEEIGQYGGIWHRTWKGLSDEWGIHKICHEHLVMTDKGGTKILPNIAESWKVSKDGKIYTFKLREGTRWSDGTPLTTEDVRFWYEDIIMNKELFPVPPRILTAGGKPLEIEIIDKYNFRVKFAEPYPLFLITLAKEGGKYTFFAPSHYLKQFHPKYTPKEKIDQLVKEAGLQNWTQLFEMKGSGTKAYLQNSELPVLWPWRAVSKPTIPVMVLERNPYYFKIDPAGNQLPYIDKIHQILVENDQMTAMKILAGEIDFQARGVGADYTLLMENREKGGYRVVIWKGSGNWPVLYLNQNVKDPILRKIFEDRRFRIALSLAINREEINEITARGLSKPRQASLVKGLPGYDPEWEKAYAEYDPKRANEILDRIGLNKRDKDGYRLRPDGKTLSLTISFMGGPGETVDALEMVKKYWENIGIKVALNPLERSLYTVRRDSGDYEVGVWSYDDVNPLASTENTQLLGVEWAPLYRLWYFSRGKQGEEPKGDIKRLYELWDKALSTVDEKQRERYFKEIINLHKKNIWMIGTIGEGIVPVPVKNNFRNVPEGIVSADFLRTPKNARPEQFFFKK